MINISIKDNINDVRKHLGWIFSDQIPFMTQVTVNGLVQDARKNVISTLGNHLHKPIGYTKSAVQFERASKKREPVAKIGFAGRGYGRPPKGGFGGYETPNQYISRLITGGTRHPKKTAIATPTRKESLTQAGNIRKDRIKQYLRNSKKYFSGVPRGFPKASAGIWRRMGPGGRKNIVMMFTWKRQTQYQKQYPLGQIVNDRVRKRFKKEFAIAFRKAMKTMR
jgi:hypothetical protein